MDEQPPDRYRRTKVSLDGRTNSYRNLFDLFSSSLFSFDTLVHKRGRALPIANLLKFSSANPLISVLKVCEFYFLEKPFSSGLLSVANLVW